LSVPPGTYNLKIPRSGAMYAEYQAQSVMVTPGTTMMDIRLEWGGNLGTFADDPVMLMRDIAAMAKVPPGPMPRMPDGKPDLSGIWVSSPYENKKVFDPPPQQPWAAEVLKQVQSQLAGATPQTFCLPLSALQFTMPFPHKIVQTPRLIVV